MALQESIKKKLQSGEEAHKFDATQSIFLFCKKVLLKSSTSTYLANSEIEELSKERDPEDSFLYIQIAETETF